MSKQLRQATTVLIVDDEESLHDTVAQYLKNYRLLRAYNGWQAMTALSAHHVDVVLLDLDLPETTGLELLERMRRDRDDFEVIIVTAHSGLPNAVEAVKRGAFDFLAKSWENYQHLDQHIERALAHRRARRAQIEARTHEDWRLGSFQLLEKSRSSRVQSLLRLARKIADTPISVLIEGESGAGKEIFARYLHAHSKRAQEPFVAVNLAAVPEQLLESHLFGHVKGAFTGAEKTRPGKFELADGGTIFLDEIGELDKSAQVKLLRVLQEREVERVGASEPSPVDVRVIAATNKELATEVREGRFREDLYFRLNVVRFPLPPLRERKEDLAAIAELLLNKHAVVMGREPPKLTKEAEEILTTYDWPGNIRELENLMMRLVAVAPGKALVSEDIPAEYCLPSLNKLAAAAIGTNPSSSGESRLYFLARAQFERYLVRLMIRRHGGSKRAAAEALGVSYSTIKEKIRPIGDE